MAIRILIVDDAMFMRIVLKNMLIKNGFEVVGEASNGLEAIKAYGQYKPDLVTMDITMPELDGIKAAKEICTLYPEAKIIMCSAMGQQSMVVDAIKYGAKDFVVKPFQEGRVIQAINKVLNL